MGFCTCLILTNRTEDKHVESIQLLCLDQGSKPCISTIIAQNISNQYFALFYFKHYIRLVIIDSPAESTENNHCIISKFLLCSAVKIVEIGVSLILLTFESFKFVLNICVFI